MSILLLSTGGDVHLPDGLQALYSFASGEGQVLKDISGRNHDGVWGSITGADANDPTWTAAGASFATDDFVDAGAHLEIRPEQWTVCAAVKQTTGVPNPLIGWGNSSFPTLYAAAPFNSNRPLIWLANGCFRYFESTNPVNVQDGQWHFLCFRCPGNTTTGISQSSLIVDGQEQAVHSTTATEDGLPKTTFLLGAAGSTYFAQMEASFLSLHDRALTDAEAEVMREHARDLLDGRVTLP